MKVQQYAGKPLGERIWWLSILLGTLTMLMLSGCISAEDEFLRQSGVISEEDYQKYVELQNGGQLDENGRYIAPELSTEETPQFSPPEGSVHVTFAKNDYIDVQYFLDSDLITPASEENCYLMPGEYLYYNQEKMECNHPSTSYYGFDKFCIYSCENGNRGDELPWHGSERTSNVVMQIPDEPKSNEISVVVLGKYEQRVLALNASYTDANKQERLLSETWVVNDIEVRGQTAKVSPAEPLRVDFKYDPEKYDFVSSTPYSFYHEKGLVRFESVSASNNITEYSVKLRSLEGLYKFDPDLYQAKNGTVVFQYNGKDLTEPTDIPDGGTIHYMAIPDLNYRHSHGEGDITVNAFAPEETDAQIEAVLMFYPDEKVKVNLPRPVGGTIKYMADGKELYGASCNLHCATEITMSFANWNGWNCNVFDGQTYTVTAQNNQAVTIDGIDIERDVFTENENHKPMLNVVLTDSVQDAGVDISASGCKQNGLTYASGNKNSWVPDWLGENDRIIFGDKIGTEQNIELSITNDTILSGEALKLNIITKDTRGNENHSIHYITKLPCKDQISLYDAESIASSPIVYEKVTVTISKVAVVEYTPRNADHAKITVIYNDVSESYALQKGDVLESSREVKISIAPDSGYYISGAGGGSKAYYETMKYSKWEKDYQKVVKKHPAQKLWYITLDTMDDYGTCVYKLEGQTLSGKISLRDGQELTLEYTITNPDYEITRSGIVGAWGNLTHKEKETINIQVSEKLDGKTIKRSDYIDVAKREG